ncbi:glycerophosphodiester phosphodiesterase family protein [Tissierella sp.]|uniref:glycerophosphodiester phosphodiesterase family protein n=1 Tax=Tissierella sp. TaxID=41274 RepID=UPI002862330E|nr:glycerophosphodiester phosphodiesterase family protein [Tissierella sp.]MDR7856698.1 glycerophosphodiester phosphodiesterase family protein [Tissierella sp.]
MFLYIFIIMIILYLVAIMPKILNRPNTDLFMGRYYAHRGLHAEQHIAPENSMAAFSLAIEQGFGIEFDVQLAKDGVPVIFHDFNLKRVCGIDKNVNELTFDELRQLFLFESKERIPHLQELIDLTNGQVPLIVEIKSNGNAALTSSVVADALNDYTGVYCVESFNPFVVLWYKKNRPTIIRGQLSMNYLKNKPKQNKLLSFILQYLMTNFITKPNFIAYDYRYYNNCSLVLCRKLFNIVTVAYTIQSKEELEYHSKHFDLLIFENFLPNNINPND